MALDLGKFQPEVRAEAIKTPVFARLALMFEQIQDSVNQIGTATGVDSTGHTSAPDAPSGINVAAANGVAHVTINDSSQRNRSLHYFVEADTTPSFSQPHIFDLGAGRGTFLPLPNKDGSGNQLKWFFKAYSMQPGSQKSSPHQVYGGQNPIGVEVGGSVQFTPLASTGGGTASDTGRRGGEGFGTAQNAKAANT